MLRRLVLLFALPLAASCARDGWDAAARQELRRRGALDQAIRDTFTASLRQVGRPDSAVSIRMLALDSANTTWLRAAVASRGWPHASVVGRDAAHAAFLIAQHAPDHAFQEEVLKLLEPLATAGEVSGQDFALLSDRVAVHAGRPQLYGTQARMRDGRVVLHPIVDSSGVDARRTRVGLPPLALYVRMLDSVYAQRPAAASASPTADCDTRFLGVWEYRQAAGDGFDAEGERIELTCSGGTLRGLYFGLEREGEHGLFYTLTDMTDLSVSPEGVLAFTVSERELFSERPTTLEDVRQKKVTLAGVTRDELSMRGRLDAGRLVLTCTSTSPSCPDDVMVFRKGRWN